MCPGHLRWFMSQKFRCHVMAIEIPEISENALLAALGWQVVHHPHPQPTSKCCPQPLPSLCAGTHPEHLGTHTSHEHLLWVFQVSKPEGFLGAFSSLEKGPLQRLVNLPHYVHHMGGRTRRSVPGSIPQGGHRRDTDFVAHLKPRLLHTWLCRALCRATEDIPPKGTVPRGSNF